MKAKCHVKHDKKTCPIPAKCDQSKMSPIHKSLWKSLVYWNSLIPHIQEKKRHITPTF
jgi:hypothetical protein